MEKRLFLTNIIYNPHMNRKCDKNIPLFYFYHALNAGLFFIPIWVTYQQEFLTFSQMAFFNAFFYFIIVIFELPTGAFADIVGRKNSMILGSIVNAIGFFTLGLYPSLTGMIINCILNGIGASLISGANQSIVYDSLKKLGKEDEYPAIWAKASLMFQIVGAFTALLGSYLYTYSSGLPYILRGVFFILSILPALFFKEPDIDSEKFTLKNYLLQTKKGLKEAFRNSYTTRISVLFILIGGIAMSNQRFFVQPFMVENGIGDIDRGWFAFGIKIFIAILTVLLASKKKFFQSKYFLLLLPFVMMLTLLPAHFLSMPLLILVFIGIAFPSGSKSVFLGYPIQKLLSSKRRATALSALNMFTSLIYGANNIIGGIVSDKYSVGWFYFSLGVVIIVFIFPLGLSIINTKNNRLH